VSALYVRVRAGEEHYAISVADVLEVAELGDVTAVPGAGAAVRGVRNLRGQVLPILDLAAALDLAPTRDAERIVIVERDGRRAGLAVESVESVASLPDAAEEVGSEHLIGAELVDGALVGVVDVGSVLDAVEGASAR
jgi:purine-binding chemotaxis protein CheW